MRRVNAWRRSSFVLGVVMVMLLAGGCGGQALDKSSAVTPAGGRDVPWPPPAGAMRQASDDIVHFAGSGFARKGGGANANGTRLKLQGGGELTWAIYTLGGCSAAVQPAQFDVDFSVNSLSPGDGTALWVGLGDYSKERWEWHKAAPPSFSNIPADPTHYYSPGGTAALAVVIDGPGYVTISEVRFHRVGNTDVAIPQNLTGSAELGIVHLDWDDVPGVDGYNVYRSLSDSFTSPVRLTATPVTVSEYDDTTVGSDITYYYKVTAVKYNESLMSDMATVHAPADNLAVPQNLTATANVGEISLQWDDVEDATGYNVYRSITSTFADPVKINTTPVATSEYVDSAVGTNKIVYYRVSAVHIGESGLSNMVDIFAPQADLPEPQNPRISELSMEYFRVAWDWDDAVPVNAFFVYVSQIPDFSLADHPESLSTMSFGRDILWEDRAPETTYYFRIVATSGGLRGRMTNDIAVTTAGYWHWNDIEIVGPGTAPLCLVSDGGDLTAAYFHGKDVDVARRDAGTWSVEPGVLGIDDDPGGFSSYLDMAASSGNYIIASFATIPGDAWVATGSPQNWTKVRVDGDGQCPPPPGTHAISGEYCKVAASSDEYGVLYQDTTAGALMLRTRPMGSNTWSSASTMRGGVVAPLYHSMAYLGSDPYVLMMDTANHQLKLGDRDGGWTWTDISNSGGEDLGSYNQLLRVGPDWWTPAVNETTGNFYTLRGGGATWEMKTVSALGVPGNPIGAYARLAQLGSEMVIVFYGYDAKAWYYGNYRNNEWDCRLLKLPDGVATGFCIDIAVIGTDPYILMYDNTDQNIKCMKGTPPLF
jgi:hypothetical protein